VFLLLVDFPDEATGADHLHVRLDDMEAVIEYLAWFRATIGDHTYEIVKQSPCPRCCYNRR
jgi:hypothetical protein